MNVEQLLRDERMDDARIEVRFDRSTGEFLAEALTGHDVVAATGWGGNVDEAIGRLMEQSAEAYAVR